MSIKTFYLLCVSWTLLALTTMYLVIQNNSSLYAALVAWLGGVLTHKLYESFKIVRHEQLARIAQR